MSLIERAVKRMDPAPAPALRNEPQVADEFGAAPPVEAVAPQPAPRAPRNEFAVPPVRDSLPGARVEPAMADDDWSAPSVAIPLPGELDQDERPRGRSKQVVLDIQRLRDGGMIAPDGDKTPLAEEFRVIKRPLLKNAFGSGSSIRNGNLIMVTSAFPREGKSFTAINLAMSIAMERDRTVLLVDADVARPSIPQKFGIAPDIGLMDVLLDSHVTLSDAIVRTNVNKLALLPAGRPHRQATELLASEAMANLLSELSARYSDRIVIFDSPPLLVTTEARTLAANMGQIVMVVESENTTHEAVREALSTIESCDVVGMVLNKGRRSNPGDSYGYYGY